MMTSTEVFDLPDSVQSPSHRLLSPKEAAKFLRLSLRSLSSRQFRIRQGIPLIRIGRKLLFDLPALDSWLSQKGS
jgi:hypothetical protein